jgi:hypothetical protein
MATAIDSSITSVQAGGVDRVSIFVTVYPEVLKKRQGKREAQDVTG